MDPDVKSYADTLFASARVESARILRKERVELQREMAARNAGNMPFSGFQIQAMVRLYAGHVERCMTARFESYQEAFVEIGRSPSEHDFSDILNEFRAVQLQEIEHSARAINEFIVSRGPIPGSFPPAKELTAHISAETHDSLLEKWKVWRAKARLKSSTVPESREMRLAGGVNDESDRRFALLAIEQAKKSVPEDARPHPRVGAIVVKGGKVLATAHRGEKPKSHAEYIVLEDKLSDDAVAGATVYTTLEPCTTRKHPKIPCAQRLVDRRVARVVIGMFDPNPDIWGKGWQLLRDAGVETSVFEDDLIRQCEEINREFIRAQKQRQSAPRMSIEEPDPAEFLEQRKKLPETELLRKIWSKPNWHIWIRPTEFKRARFQNVEQCRQFLLSSEVIVRGWFSFPYFSPKELDAGDEWIAGEIEHSERTLYRAERAALFRSGQFVHNKSLDQIAQLGDRLHVLEVLDTVTAAVEFAARMAESNVLCPNAAITLQLRSVAGRSLTWPQDNIGDIDVVGRTCWAQDDTVHVERRITAEELKSRRRELAVEVAAEIYAKFGWSEPPLERLRQEQQKRFG
jgi:pyrimidine deaminase RibD-like protein